MGILEVSYYYPNFISLFDHFSIGNRDINVLSSGHFELVHRFAGLGGATVADIAIHPRYEKSDFIFCAAAKATSIFIFS